MDNMKPSSIPVLLAYIVAQEDEVWRRRLDQQLAPLRRRGLLETWSPTNVSAGSDHDLAISAQLARASIVILLLSPDYIDSDQCYRLQEQALARQDVQVLPVLVRSVSLYGSQILHLTKLPRDGLAVTEAGNVDAALHEIASEIYTIIDPEGATQFPASLDTSDEAAQAEELARRQDFLQEYRAKIGLDTALTELQILGMSDPLSVADVYVKVHLHRQPRASSGSDEKESRDPMAIFQLRRLQLEHKVGTSVNPEIAVKSHKYCVIVGDPGAGKSTLLRHLAVQLAEQDVAGLPAMPIYLKLHELAQQTTIDLFQVALASVCAYGFPREQTERFLVDLMEQGKVLLLLDALDETGVGTTTQAAEQSYQNVVKAIQQIIKRFLALRIVISSRKADYFRRPQMQGFTELEVLDFLPREIEQFVRKWFQHSGEIYWQRDADALIRELRSKPRVATLAANPLLLTLIIITYKNHARSLPDSRAQLYEKCVSMLLHTWDDERNIMRMHAPIISVHDQELLLPEIAWHFHQLGLWYFPAQELLTIIEDFLSRLGLSTQKALNVLKEISGENGLLREQAAGYYGFLHLTIQEYFAAEYSKNETEELLKHLGDSWWEEVILLSAGRTRDAGPLLQHLVVAGGEREIPEDVFYSKLILAGRYLAARPPIGQTYQHLRQEIPARLFATAYTCPYTIILEPLTEALAEIGRMYVDSDVNERLIEILVDETVSQTLKGYILLALGTYGSKTLSSTLLTMFKQQQFDWIPAVISSERLPFDLLETTLGSLCDTSQLFTLFELLEDEHIVSSTNVDVVALIGRIGGEMAISRLMRLLENPATDWLVRSAIPRVLGLYGTKAMVIPTLTKWLRDPELANYCADGLLLLNDASITSDLVAVLSNKEISVPKRTYIAHLLTQFGDDSLVPPLLALFEDPSLEESIQAAMANTLVMIGDESVKIQLFELVAHSRASDPISQEIVQAFSSVGENTILTRLQQLEEVPTFSSSLRQAIVLALGILGDPIALTRLIQELKQIRSEVWDDEIQMVIPIIESIVRYGSLDQITSLLNNAQYASQVRIRLLDYLPELATMQQKTLVHILIDIISNRTIIESVRHAAVWALGQIGNTQEVVERLIACVPGSSSTDEIYRALWRVSRRAGVRVVPYGPGGMQLRVWNW